jgi:NAD(P)-dependent dehydrogenase (short-subunit alcohol dehydrogenase family)
VQSLAGKVAVVTGAASGIGLALARRFGQDGMRVVMADIEQSALDREAEVLAGEGIDVFARVTDTSLESDVDALAEATLDHFGGVHVVCNNAGVGSRGLKVADLPRRDFEWVIGVNLWGVINGIRAFLPRLLAQDEGHIVNTASVAGLISPPGMGAYCVSKHAVVTLSESLLHDLAERGSRVGVSVLCPAYVPTAIANSERNRPPSVSTSEKSAERLAKEAALKKAVAAGKLSAGDVARAVVAAVKENRFYVLTHPAIKGAVRARMEDVLDERAPRDPLRLK